MHQVRAYIEVYLNDLTDSLRFSAQDDVAVFTQYHYQLDTCLCNTYMPRELLSYKALAVKERDLNMHLS